MEDDPAHGRVLEGKLVERTITDVVINVRRAAPLLSIPPGAPTGARAQVKGRKVSIPWHLVKVVRLPPAKRSETRRRRGQK